MAKGSNFERKICTMLSEWWTYGKRQDIFWRSAISGGRATMRSRQGKSTFGQYGDVQATDPIGQPLIDLCTIELKRGYKGATIGDVLDKGPKSAMQPWESWIEQAREECEQAKTPEWMLITKRDRRGIAIYMPSRLYRALCHVEPEIRKIRPNCRFLYKSQTGESLSIFGTSFLEFLKCVNPCDIVSARKDYVEKCQVMG